MGEFTDARPRASERPGVGWAMKSEKGNAEPNGFRVLGEGCPENSGPLVGTGRNRDKGPDESSPEGPKAEGGGQAGAVGRWEECLSRVLLMVVWRSGGGAVFPEQVELWLLLYSQVGILIKTFSTELILKPQTSQ